MRWPHYEHIFFDCDSTLTTVEGIDILAETAGKKWRVEVLTKAAMDGDLDLEAVYGRRLQAVRATRGQIRDIRNAYKQNVVEDAAAVIAALHALGHKVYIISGGLAEPVEEFGVFLGVPRERIRAVGIDYDQLSGDWWQKLHEHRITGDERYLTYAAGALTVTDGKAEVVQELLAEQNGRSLLIGDGSSDLQASRAVDLFVGFGGVVTRERVRAAAPAFIHSSSLAPLLLLAAGPAAQRQVTQTSNQPIFAKGMELTQRGAVSFNDERLKTKFDSAFRAAYQAIHPRSH